MRRTSAHCIGTYRPWFARVLRWMIKRNSSSTVEVQFRGRGKAKKGIKRAIYRYGLPVSKATKVAVYLYVKPSMRFPAGTGSIGGHNV